MRVKELICKVLMVLCLAGLFCEFNSDNVHAEEWKARVYKSFHGGDITIKSKDKIIYKVLPQETASYDIILKCDRLPGELKRYSAHATLYNADKKFISNVPINSDVMMEYYLCKGKFYYVVIEKDESCESLNAMFRIDMHDKREPYDAIYDASLSKEDNQLGRIANIKGVSYEYESQTLVFDNYNGSDEFVICSYLGFMADSQDWPNYPNFNIVIKGENNIEYNKASAKLFAIYRCGVINIVGDGTLNIKFNGKNNSEYDRNSFIEGNNALINIDGPTINIEKASRPVISTSMAFDGYGKLSIKSGSVNIKEFINDSDYYYSAIETSYLEMIGGSFVVNYMKKDDDMPSHIYETIHVDGGMDVTGGNIVITGDEKVLNNVIPIAAGCGVYEKVKDLIVKVKNLDVSKLDTKLEKNVYKYDGTEKNPKITIDGLKEGKQFKVSYLNNIKVGTAKVIINGIGMFTGSKIMSFKIVEGIDKNGSYDGYHGNKAGSIMTDGKLLYKVIREGTLDGKEIGKVSVVGLAKKFAKKVSIKSQINIYGVKYKVTAIGKKAFKKSKKLKTIVIGKSVFKIGKGAFAGCKNLKSIKIKTKKLKKFVNGIFKGTKKTCVIMVPKSKKKYYTKKIKKAGFKGVVK